MRKILLLAATLAFTACGGSGGGGGGGGGGGTPVAATPTFSPAGGSYGSAQSVTISTTTPSATIHFTSDGSTPTTGSPVYSAPVSVAASKTLQALATAAGYTQSAVGSAAYTIAGTTPQAALPVITPGTGSYTSAQTVSITDGTPGATIRYTTDGNDPTGASPLYTAPFAVTSTATVKALATAPGYTASAVAVATLSVTISSSDFAAFCAGIKADSEALQVSCTKINPAMFPFFGGVPCDAMVQEIQLGRLSYDPTHAADCRAAVAPATCAAWALTQGGEPAACRLALPGLVANGGACYDGTVCANGYCDVGARSCPGTCTPYVAAGGACPSYDSCAPGLLCDGALTPTCRAPSTAGGTCPCQPGLVCYGNTCVAPLAAGTACNANSSTCAVGLTCAGNSGATTCQPLVGPGGACNTAATYTTCGEGYHCASSVCVSDPLAGQACTVGQFCIGGLCDANTLKCVNSPGPAACSSAPSVAGMTLYDAFTSPSLSNQKWQGGGARRGVSGGEAFFGLDVADLKPRTLRNDGATSTANVQASATNRATTLQADLRIPAATASRSGTAVARAFVRQLYSPPAQRAFAFPGALQDQLVAEVGLIEDGTGLKVYRQFSHCDDPACATLSTTGISVVDPAGVAAITSGIGLAGAAAAYDTPYNVTISLQETTSLFTWTITGGALPAGGLTGTADPAAYLAASPSWSPPGGTAILLAGTGFQAGQLGVRANDNTGGGTARFVGWFDNVKAGFNNGAAALYDDFSGTVGYSGPTDLSPARWAPAGNFSAAPSDGSLRETYHLTTFTNPFTNTLINPAPSFSLPVSDPIGLNALQVDAGFVGYATTGTGNATVSLIGRLYNDGTGTRANDATGDVQAQLSINAAGTATWSLSRCTTGICASQAMGSGGIPGATGLSTGSHRLLLRWDTVAKKFTFGVDGILATVDPAAVGAVSTGGSVTLAVPSAGPPRAPLLQINSGASVSSTVAGATTGVTVRLNDVYTGP
jgi:hypothetical protein